MDRRAWLDTVHGITKSRTQLNRLSMHTCTFSNKDESVCISQKTDNESLFNAGTPRFLTQYIIKEKL